MKKRTEKGKQIIAEFRHSGHPGNGKKPRLETGSPRGKAVIWEKAERGKAVSWGKAVRGKAVS